MSAAAPPQRPPLGRPKDPAKRAAVLEAAQQLFSEQGFDGVSMDQIAQTAGVSKLTVYSHFGDKDGLLSAVVRSHCEREMPLELFEPSPEVALRPSLLDIAHAFYAMVSCPQAIAGHRMLCAPHAMTPNMARLFWEAGPERIQNGLSEMLKRRVDAGELDIDDTDMAASHFFALLKGEPHARLMIGFPADMDQGATERHLASVVDLFLRAHQPAAS